MRWLSELCVHGWCIGQVVGALGKLGYAFEVSRKGVAFMSLVMRWLRLVRGCIGELCIQESPWG